PKRQRHGSAWLPCLPCMALAAVAVRVTRDRTLHGVAEATPRISRCVLGVLPFEGGASTCTRPVPAQLRFDLVERAVGVAGERVHTIPIGRPVVVIGGAARHIGLRAVVVAPVGLLGGWVDGLGHALSGQRTRYRACHGPDRSADRTGHAA